MDLTPEERRLEELLDQVSEGKMTYYQAELRMKAFKSNLYRDKLLNLIDNEDDG